MKRCVVKRKLKIDLLSLITSLVFMVVAYFIKDKTTEIIFWSLAFIIGGRSKAVEGVKKTIEEKSLNVEFLMILSALAAFFIGNYQEGAILIFIFALSGVLEEYTLNKSSVALESLMKLVPETAVKIVNDKELIININELNIDDIVLVKVGQQVPADGIIIKGSTIIDESMITGEYIAVEKEINSPVLSGTINQTSAIYVKITASAKDSAMQKIIDFIQKAQNEQTKTEIGIQKFEKYYVYIILIASVLMMIVPPIFDIWDFDTSFYKGIVLLVVASPCALVASVSPVMLSTMSRATKEGVLIKGANAIQNLSNVKTVFFDKTGTITIGYPDVISIDLYVDNKIQILEYIYNIEKHSNHPLATAIVNHLNDEISNKNMAIETTEQKGRGMESIINNEKYFIGKTNLDDMRIKKEQEKGYTTSEITINDVLVGIISFSDKIRENVNSTVKEIKNSNIETIMLTGDNLFNAESIAKKVGIDRVIANCLPEDKVKEINQAKTNGMVAMIGDGINDGPSLTVADVGIAMGSGSDIALETAEIVLMHNDIEKIPKTIKLSKKAKRIYTQNIIFSITVIIFLIFMNVLGLIKLPLGVVFHEGSTILVILNGLRMLID